MPLRSKAALIFFGILIVYGAADYAVHRFVVLPGFVSLERDEARKDLERVVEALRGEIHHLNTFCSDWAEWDDTYEFMISRSNRYIGSNLVPSTFTDNNINIIYFVDTHGRLVWGGEYYPEAERLISPIAFEKGALPGKHPLVSDQKRFKKLCQGPACGVVSTDKGPMLVAAQPVLTSEGKGPGHGTLIMGRRLDDRLLKTLMSRSKVLFSIQPAGAGSSIGQARKTRAVYPSGTQFLPEEQEPSHLVVRTVFPDVTGDSAFLITAKVPRSISLKGHETTRYATLLGFVSMLLVLLIMLFVLRRTIIRPIIELKNHAFSIGKTGDLSARVSIDRRDEIGLLGLEFNRMTERLQERSDRLEELNRELKRDIEKRVRAEEALRASEERYRLHFENVFDVIFSIDPGLNVVTVSPSVEKTLGYTPDEMIGRSLKDLNILAPEYLETALLDIRRVLAGERINSAVYEFITRNGSRKRGEVSGSPLIKGGKTVGIISVARDITEKSRLEEQVRRTQVMEAIATLAGGIAHEFNNALMGIIGNIELLKMDLPEDEATKKYFEAMGSSGHRMSRLTDQLLAYAQGGKYHPKNLKLDDFVMETLPILRHELHHATRGRP